MPNWCMNSLVIEHDDPKEIARFVKAFQDDRTCAEFLPMPDGEDWYDWCVSKWGTKWDFGSYGAPCEPETPTKFYCSFSTAWAPPLGLYEELKRKGFRVDASYFEPGMAFCGQWKNGTDTLTNYLDPEDIPDDIKRAFDVDSFFED